MQGALQPGYAYGNEFSVGLELILEGLACVLEAEQSDGSVTACRR